MAKSMSQQMLDTDKRIDAKFALFALRFEPRTLEKLIIKNEDRQSLKDAFCIDGFTQETSNVMGDYANKFLWPELLNALMQLST